MVEITQGTYDGLATALLWQAKKNRAKYKYSEDSMARCAGIVGQEGQPSTMIPLMWENNEEKQRMFYALSMTAKGADARAVFLIMDSRWVESTSFTEHFKIPSVAELGVEQFQARYMEVMKDYDNSIQNLPRHLWMDAVAVVLKGPGIKPVVKLASYIQGPNDTVEYTGRQFFDGDEWRAIVNFLPDWWMAQ